MAIDINMIESGLKKIYLELIQVEKKDSYLEIYLPIFLDDIVIFSLYITEKNDQLIFSTNLLSELEYSLQKKVSIKNNIRKKYFKDENEFKEIKKALNKVSINTSLDNLEYVISNPREVQLVEEIICYSERIKSYYNNMYHILVDRYLQSNKKEKIKLYYDSFNEIMEVVKTANIRENLRKYENEMTNNPIYLNEEKVISAAKDLDSLLSLYAEIEEVGRRKGIIYLDSKEKEVNFDVQDNFKYKSKSRTKEKKAEAIKYKFEKIGIDIKEKKLDMDNIVNEIREFIDG